MKIVGVDVYEVLLSYAHGEYAMSGGRVATHQQSTVVRVRTDEGIDGWGENCPLGGTYLPAFPEGGRAALNVLGQAILGLDPRDVGVVQTRMARTLTGFHDARSALDIACWDILGKSLDRPLSALLGGVRQADFPVYEAVPLSAPETMAEFITSRREAGITCFQVKVGNRPADDVRRTVAAVEVAGDSRIICDSNGGWRFQDALIAIGQMRDLPVYIEQPCASMDDCARLRPLSSLPFVMDESVVTMRDLYEAKAGVGAGSVNMKLGRLGGITPMARMRDTAVALGVTVSLEDTWGGDITTAAVSHLAATTEADDLLSVSFQNDWVNEHVAPEGRPEVVHGRGAAPDGSGLGVVVDVEMLGAPLFSI